ncbi:ATP-binding cassette domain-containing protein [Halopseudomonas pelagia]|uniref:UvrABC system protein A n=1 Tax=Halopseudomonas pelagia TaxID=553151 RepID=A0AA91U217_9GAMM|nr:ATP-binding cassette domain-containing protein [Halopseudomonas pelagia]PCC99260.1 GTPase EngC [Halopseudomonas pelagia]QFY55036.1 ATP-binding cassette domain-containing protein [Halopseudomonas pelagia]
MSAKKTFFEITGITENNLKNIDFYAEAAEVILINGVSGSGKSTLVNQVIAAEAMRQSKLRRKSDNLFDYCVRPNFQAATRMPESAIISQRSVMPSASSTFGTRTGLNDLLIRLFVQRGEIHYRGSTISKPSIETIIQFRQLYHPQARILGCIARYEEIGRTQIDLLRNAGIKQVFLRAEGKHALRPLALGKLVTSKLTACEVFIDLDIGDAPALLKKSKAVPVLMDDSLEIDFNECGVALEDGTVFRLPSKLLFSRSAMSSHSGCCRVCGGTGTVTHYDVERTVDGQAPLKNGFLNVPLSPSGRYKGFKFLPSGLLALLKKEGIDVNKSYCSLSNEHKSTILNILKDKLARNNNDPAAQQFISIEPCNDCEGSGLGWQARSVTFNGKSIAYFFGLTPSKLLTELLFPVTNKDDGMHKLRVVLDYLSALSIDHINLNRPTLSMSSGELQRMRLLPVLINQYSGRLVIIDEPSSNLQYRDNLKILQLINQLRARNNSILIVDHNPVYRTIADRTVKIGPGPGHRGGFYCVADDYAQSVAGLGNLVKNFKPAADFKYITLELQRLRSLHLEKVRIPYSAFTAIIGSSGAGKSTLCRELIYPALLQRSENVVLLDSTPPRGASNSIVATYLNVFDKIRKFYAQSDGCELAESDFSFNSTGACGHCQGTGIVAEQVCSLCFGSRFRSEIALLGVEGITLTDLLAADLDQIPLDGGLAFLSAAINILKRLSLSHLSLGRKTGSLSGGELQRLKVARFLMAHQSDRNSSSSFVILDEPCRGLDPQAVKDLFETLKDFLSDATVLVIEHNPHFIYRCEFIIDMGEGSGLKDDSTVVQGQIGEKEFPSLNHARILTESGSPNGLLIPCEETDLHIEDDEFPKELNGKRYGLILPLFIKQKNFALEEKFSEYFNLVTPDDNIFLHRSREALERALQKERRFFFNPFIALLERFPRVPISLQREILKKFDKRNIDCDDNPWSFRVCADSLQSAYLNGAGVVIVPRTNGNFDYHTVRLLSLHERVVDRAFPHEFAFNLYRNSCHYCSGYGHIQSYPLREWINSSCSVLESDFMHYPLHKVIPKATIKRFAKEELFDLSKPAVTLSEHELNILLYGFKAYKFRKRDERDDSESAFFEWRGVNSYLYRNAEKLSPGKNINNSIEWLTCPFCIQGYSDKVRFYGFEGGVITDFLREDL